MKNPRSIVLAMVSAKNDHALQIILKQAKDVDPKGLQTRGLITKPDTSLGVRRAKLTSSILPAMITSTFVLASTSWEIED